MTDETKENQDPVGTLQAVEAIGKSFASVVDQLVEHSKFKKVDIAVMGFAAMAKILYDDGGYEDLLHAWDCVKRLADRDQVEKEIPESNTH